MSFFTTSRDAIDLRTTRVRDSRRASFFPSSAGASHSPKHISFAFSIVLIFILALLPGCDSPEMGRERGGGHGGDGGNYSSKGVHVPSKLDGTKTRSAGPKT